jgi:CDP-diacylglycerol--serine O-phosphatidyltransferase
MKDPKHTVAFLLPNTLTAASIFSGVLSMVHSINAEFETAAWLIFLSLIFDGLDGRVARLTNSCSKFGMEFDSLADIVSFGVAPALLTYLYAGVHYGRFGIVVVALFVILGAIRLARFNVMSSSVEPSVFIGVPIPTAAVFISLLILFFHKYEFSGSGVLILVFSLIVSLLMVSNIRYPSFKKIDPTKKSIKKIFIVITIVFSLVFIYPIEGIVFILFSYILYGPYRAVSNILKMKKTTPR